MVGRSSVKTVIVDQGPTLTDVHRDMLQCNFQEKDIKSVLDAIPVTKAPELDGFNSLFSTLLCQDIIKQDIIKQYNRGQVRPSCMMKLDLRKAYDTVDWKFIKKVMLELGFPASFVHLVMTCLSTTQYSILINGLPSPLIQPRRGEG
ncbi:uncharacterized protein [Spinacia oleracea]|uniref:Reverse transcriptase domain-containing protein n=1 Tax=Spinacia oleracea TaxID=3562 RepID=A0ABM3RJ76_SPIOL|nr:uncharacterized protein LOC130470089 [Spinacia oleracea]